MKNSQLIALLNALNEEEWQRLKDFLHSPLLTKYYEVEELQELLDYFKTKITSGERQAIDKKQLRIQLFGDKMTPKGKLEKMMSTLLSIVRSFINFQYAVPTHFNKRAPLAMLHFYGVKGMNRQFLKAVDRLRDELDVDKLLSYDQFFDRFLFEQELYTFKIIHNDKKGDVNLLNTLESLDLFYITTKMEYVGVLISQNIDIVLNLDTQALIEEITAFIHKRSFQDIPFVDLNYHAILVLHKANDPEHKAYYRFKQLLDTYGHQIPVKGAKSLHTVARNYCIMQYNKGDQPFVQEAYDLYRQHLEWGYLYYNNRLNPSAIINICRLGLELEQYDWVWDFLENHKDRIIGTRYPQEVYYLNLANYYFALRQYTKALECLGNSYEDTYYKIAARRLEIKIFYEERSAVLEAKLDAFKVFIFRMGKKNLPQVHQQANNDYVDILKQILHSKTLNNQDRIAKLRMKIQEKTSLSEKSWLLKKLDELQ
ncbi:MAG: hypothetical protein AAGG75_23450 [Bacteroidota bacterium]